MRVCFLTTSYPRFPGDVAGSFIARLAGALHEKGVLVRVVAPNDGICPTEDTIEGVSVYRFNYFLRNYQGVAYGYGGVPANLMRRPHLILQLPFFFLFFLFKAWSVARHCDLLHIHWAQNLMVGWLVARLLWKPSVVTLWGSDLQWMEKKKWVYSLTRPLLAGADRVVCLTQATQKWLEGRGIMGGRACLIPNGVDTDLFCPRDKIPLQQELGLPPQTPILLYVGSLIPRKGLQVLIDAIPLMKAAKERLLLVLVGEGEDRLKLEEKSGHLGLTQRIRFVGALPPEQIPLWMAAADLFALPSFYEGFPNVLLEAMASGLPVVATDIPGNRDALRAEETGLLVPAGDPQALATALDKMVANGELRAQMGKAARLSILERRLTWEECASRHVQLYRQIL